jgi:outer membrane biosynthesis protein TonB
MIPRILVPKDARPPVARSEVTTRRRPTALDERTLVPAMLPVVALDGHTTIPSNLPLESIAARVVVPRDVSREAYSVVEDVSIPLQPTDLDERIAVPQGSAPPEPSQHPLHVSDELVDPDIFLTGEVQLIVPETKEVSSKWQLVTRTSSVVFHVSLIALFLLWTKFFPPHEPTQEEVDLARKQLTLLLPPGAFEPSKPEVRPAPPKVKVDPRILKKVAPPIEPTPPAPVAPPERTARELPNAPVPKANDVQQEQPSTIAKVDPPKPQPKLEVPDTPTPQRGLILPKQTSPSQSIQDSLRAAARSSGPRPIVGGGQVSPGRPGGGGSGGQAFGGLEMLTPDEGVDFSGYLARVYFTVKRNWFAVMPTSVELGEQGIVVLTFRIMRNGTVPTEEPVIQRNSGKEHLDRAAYSSVRASSPFEPLPPQFSGPYIELRYTYLYNISPDSLNH